VTIVATGIGDRLRRERERLGLSQTAFATLAGASKRAQIRYEAGERSPDAEYLARLARHRVDVYWIITGKKR
jgi:transcriptional regulator with XRE-family HTH domain